MTGSPISVPYNLAATILLVTLIGIVTAIIGIFRKEKYRAWSVATIAAHLLCFHWVATVTEWAFNPPPGVDY